jgi:hypothetical protein
MFLDVGEWTKYRRGHQKGEGSWNALVYSSMNFWVTALKMLKASSMTEGH